MKQLSPPLSILIPTFKIFFEFCIRQARLSNSMELKDSVHFFKKAFKSKLNVGTLTHRRDAAYYFEQAKKLEITIEQKIKNHYIPTWICYMDFYE